MECVESEEESLSRYVEQCGDRLIKCVIEEGLLPSVRESAAALKKKRKEKRLKEWKVEITTWRNDSGDRGCYECKKETEGMIFAAQEQALRTNWVKKNIDKKDQCE